MSKTKTSFNCSNCTYKTIKWLGCCPECNEWNSFVEQTTNKQTTTQKKSTKAATLTSLKDIESKQYKRIATTIDEWDRVVGGGLMPHSLIILTGDPGIGKSTLLLHVAHNLAQKNSVWYFSTEESLSQIKQRAIRLQCTDNNLLFSDQAELHNIIQSAQEQKPDIIIIDSIQNCYLSDAQTLPGSIGQLREATFALMRLAKEHHITIIITGHITKEGTIAGPKTLEHMVDAVFYLQRDDNWDIRVLRSVKNRFGTINELGFFEMTTNGLQPVGDINKHTISHSCNAPGALLTTVLEGSRPLIIELQALTIATRMNIPQRVISGLPHKQVTLIAAILEKYLKVKLSAHDIFVKISGGIKINGHGCDLVIALALLSSYFQEPLDVLALGEISLTGEIKPLTKAPMLIAEAQKFGINNFIISATQMDTHKKNNVTRCKHVYELLSLFNFDN